MATVIRMSRGGAKKKPYYRLVVTDSRAPRDGDFIERVGSFDPMLPKENTARVVINMERAKHWLSVGAKPSDRVAKLFADAGLGEKPSFAGKPIKTRKKADKLSRVEKRAAAELEAKAQAEADAKAAAEAPAVEAAAEEAPAA
jgi:small subunit ribosomal protein S16